jgi:hypothetical protein
MADQIHGFLARSSCTNIEIDADSLSRVQKPQQARVNKDFMNCMRSNFVSETHVMDWASIYGQTDSENHALAMAALQTG